jgi:hypothetical protein
MDTSKEPRAMGPTRQVVTAECRLPYLWSWFGMGMRRVSHEVSRKHQASQARAHPVIVVAECGHPTHATAHNVVQRSRVFDPNGPTHTTVFAPQLGRQVKSDK